MNKTIEERVKEVMALKSIVGEFSLDLYFDDTVVDDGKQYTAKVHSSVDNAMLFYGKGESFSVAIDKAEEYVKNYKTV